MTAPDYPPEELPAHDRLADDQDELDWNVDRDGRMAEHASDDEPATEVWDADEAEAYDDSSWED